MNGAATVLVVAAGAAALWGIFVYNLLVRDRNRALAGWSDVDVQLKRRHDLLPKLVEAVRQYASYEQATLARVTELRSRSQALADVGEKGAVEAGIGLGIRRLLAVAEAYPDLKANASFLDLQRAVTEVEDHIQYARRYYNGAVRAYNTRIESFPDLLVARVLGFRQRAYFELEPAEAGAGPLTDERA